MKYVIYLLLLLSNLNLKAQTFANRNAQLKEIADKIETYYIFEDIGKVLSKKINLEIENKTFNGLSNQEFADSLSSYLSKNGNDLHFNVRYLPNQKKEAVNEKELLKEFKTIHKKSVKRIIKILFVL